MKKAILKREQPANAAELKESTDFDPADMYRTAVEVYRERASQRSVRRDLEGLTNDRGMIIESLAKMSGHKPAPSMYLIEPRTLLVVEQVKIYR